MENENSQKVFDNSTVLVNTNYYSFTPESFSDEDLVTPHGCYVFGLIAAHGVVNGLTINISSLPDTFISAFTDYFGRFSTNVRASRGKHTGGYFHSFSINSSSLAEMLSKPLRKLNITHPSDFVRAIFESKCRVNKTSIYVQTKNLDPLFRIMEIAHEYKLKGVSIKYDAPTTRLRISHNFLEGTWLPFLYPDNDCISYTELSGTLAIYNNVIRG